MSLRKRWRVHVQAARCGKKYAISCAIRKYGEDEFTLLEIDEAQTLEGLNRLEAFYIGFYNTISPSGYNLDSGGNHYLTHPETKAKISAANKGKSPSAEARAKMSAAGKGNKNGVGSKSRTGQKNTLAANIKIAIARRGKPGHAHTPEFKARLSERNRGNTYARGIPKTYEHRARISEGLILANKRRREALNSVQVSPERADTC